MKKILAISVAFIYLAISSGLVLQIHYCMGKAIGSAIQFADNEKHSCDKCGMENGKNKCCHDEVKLIKLQDAHKQVSTDYQVTAPAVQDQAFNFIDPSYNLDETPATDCSAVSPDDDSGQSLLYIFNGVLRL